MFDTKIRTLTFEGNTNIDKAHELWYNGFTPSQRAEVGDKVKSELKTKSMVKIHRACLNYVADNLESFNK